MQFKNPFYYKFFKYSFACLCFSPSDSQSLGYSCWKPPKTLLDKSMKGMNGSKARGKGECLVLNVPRHESSGVTKTKQKDYSSTTKYSNVCACFLEKCTCLSIIQFLHEDLAQLWERFLLPNNFILYMLQYIKNEIIYSSYASVSEKVYQLLEPTKVCLKNCFATTTFLRTRIWFCRNTGFEFDWYRDDNASK